MLCRGDVRSGKYWIVAVEPNTKDWQPLDVVPRTCLSIDFEGKTSSHHDYTREIKVPYWTNIGQEVEH